MGKDKNESIINIEPLIDYLKTRDIQHVNGTDSNFKSALQKAVPRVAPKSTQTQLSLKAVQMLVEHFEKDPKLSLIERDKIYQKLASLETSARKNSKTCPKELKPYINSYKDEASYINTTSIQDILNPEKGPSSKLLESIDINTLNGLVEHYKRREFLEETDPEKRQAKLEEVFEKIAALAHLGGKKTKFPPELASYMEVYNKIDIKKVQQALDQDEELRNFTLALKEQIDKTIVQENEATPQNLQDRRFDSLSRLIAHGSQCSAVCFSGEKILVAFNELHAGNKNSTNSINNGIKTHTVEVFEYLKDYAIYAKLSTEIEQKEFLTDKDLPHRRQKLLVNAAQYYYSNNTAHKELLQHILQGLDENNKEIIKLCNVDDEITAAAIRARMDLMKLEDSLTPSTDKDKQFDQKIINALIERPQPYEIVLDGPHDSKAHAEMRIVEYIEKRIKELERNPIQDPNNQLRSNIYVGLSKLCCIDCNLAINKDKKLEFVLHTNNGAILTVNSTRGSHGEGFEWVLVEAITNNSKFLEDFLGTKAHGHYKKLNAKQADIALLGVVRYIAQGKLKVDKKEIKIESQKTTNSTKIKKHFAKHYPYNSDTEAEEKNEPRNKIIADAIYGSTFPAAQIQPIISTIQPNVPTTLDAALEEIKKLQAEKIELEKKT